VPEINLLIEAFFFAGTKSLLDLMVQLLSSEVSSESILTDFIVLETYTVAECLTH